MKLKLLLGALMLSAFTINAQVSTINENFDNFTLGNATFPQSGWSAVIAPITSSFPQVSPRMLVAGDTNRFIQSYAGNNGTDSSYLISPQIETPTGGSTLNFTTTLVSPSPGPGTIQIGIVSSPSDMSTFVPVGNLINVTDIGVIQNISVPIPASTGSYLAFKFTPSTTHVAIQIDDVVYSNSTLGVSNNNFKSKEEVKFAVNADHTALQFVSKTDLKNIRIYSAGAQKVAEGQLKRQQFDISTLQSGVYYIVIDTAKGTTIQSKFIKK